MTARLNLLAHAPSAATRDVRFPEEESIEERAAAALRGRLRPYACVLTSPLRAARETAAALGVEARVEIALGDCDYGRWRGLPVTEVASREPKAFAQWLGDPDAAPHDGESVSALIARAGAWLATALARDGSTLAVTHAAFVRAAIVSALGAGPAAFWRVDVAPLAVARLSGRDGRWNLMALGPLELRS